MTRRGSWTGLAAFALWALSPGSLAGQISVDQAELQLQPQQLTGISSFNVRNESGNVIEASVYLEDWDRAENGDNRFLPSGSLPQSCAPYLKVFPLSLRLPPGASQTVRLNVEGADSLAATCWSIVFVESGRGAMGTNRNVTYVMRIGVKVYIAPPGLGKDGEIEEMSVDSGKGARRAAGDTAGRPHVWAAFRNSGGVPYWVRGAIEYRRLDNSVVATDSIVQFPILPGARRRFARPVPQLAAGHYVALMLLDFGGAEVAAGQVQVDVH